jgi:amino acid transporter
MEEIVKDLATLETVVVVLIAFGLDAIPGIKDWWNKKNPAQKQIWIIAIMFLLTVLAQLVTCYRGICPADWIDWIFVTIDAFIVNYLIANTTHYGTNYMTGGNKEKEA